METQTSQSMEQDGQGGVLDESSMIREQDRLARERKRKKNRRKKSIAGAVLLTLAAAGVWYLGWGRSLFAREPENQADIKVREGQEIVYARLDSVRGNEVTYTIAGPSGEPETLEDVFNTDLGLPGENQEGKSFEKTKSMESASTQFIYENVTYLLTDETVTAQIPVGTDVTTKLGAVTTFSRLAAGDHVALIVENDGDSQIITAVYIIG